MTAGARRFLDKAHDLLDRGKRIAGIGLAEGAGRAGYRVAFHPAQALVYARSGRIAKTHRGVRVEFARHVQMEPGLAPWLVTFLARSFELKSIVDYGTGAEAAITTTAAEMALAEPGASSPPSRPCSTPLPRMVHSPA